MKIMVQLLSSGLWSDGFPDRWTAGGGGEWNVISGFMLGFDIGDM